MKKRFLLALVLVSVLTPAFGQSSRTAEEVYGGVQSPNPSPRQDLQNAEVEFVDSPNAYWVNRGVNDTIYGSGGSVNAVRFERYQSRDEAIINKLRKPLPPVEVIVNGKAQKTDVLTRFRPRKLENH